MDDLIARLRAQGYEILAVQYERIYHSRKTVKVSYAKRPDDVLAVEKKLEKVLTEVIREDRPERDFVDVERAYQALCAERGVEPLDFGPPQLPEWV